MEIARSVVNPGVNNPPVACVDVIGLNTLVPLVGVFIGPLRIAM